jgi:dienelactone hydrolase
MKRAVIGALIFFGLACATPAAPASINAKGTSPIWHSSVEDGYRIDEGFFSVKIAGNPFLLQGLIVKKADAVGKLPITIYTHGATTSIKRRQEMSPRGPKDVNLRLVRDYARRGWLAVFVLRRAYGQSDGPDPVTGFKCDTTDPTFQDWMDAAADDLEATLAYLSRREDADLSRIMALGVSGGGAAVVALGARNIPGLKVVVSVSGGFVLANCGENSGHPRLIEAMRYYGTKAKVPNLWYYAKNDSILPEGIVAKMREAFLEGGGSAKLVLYPNVIDPATNQEVDGHLLWATRTSAVMLDVDRFLRSDGLPTWDYGEAKALAEKHDIEIAPIPSLLELYLASPGYKALAQSTTSGISLADTYASDTPEHAKVRALTACQRRYPGHTCRIIDPPGAHPPRRR